VKVWDGRLSVSRSYRRGAAAYICYIIPTNGKKPGRAAVSVCSYSNSNNIKYNIYAHVRPSTKKKAPPRSKDVLKRIRSEEKNRN